jgi:hypothetical protein
MKMMMVITSILGGTGDAASLDEIENRKLGTEILLEKVI